MTQESHLPPLTRPRRSPRRALDPPKTCALRFDHHRRAFGMRTGVIYLRARIDLIPFLYKRTLMAVGSCRFAIGRPQPGRARNRQGATSKLPHVRQPRRTVVNPARDSSLDRNEKQASGPRRSSVERDKVGDGFARFWWEETEEGNTVDGARLTIGIGAEFLIGPTSPQPSGRRGEGDDSFSLAQRRRRGRATYYSSPRLCVERVADGRVSGARRMALSAFCWKMPCRKSFLGSRTSRSGEGHEGPEVDPPADVCVTCTSRGE